MIFVTEEPWARVATECEALGEAHHIEATAGLEGPFRFNREAVANLDAAGAWRVFTARETGGRLLGYCTWLRGFSIEADAPLNMVMAHLYVMPDAARHGLGAQLLDMSRRTFKREGVVMLKLHHTMHGRGAKLGRFFERMGAVEQTREYLLRIGD